MTEFLLAVHVITAIVAIGPVTVAASMFPPAARAGKAGELKLLNRICKAYAALGVAVPLFGMFTASSLGVLGDAWLITSIVLTALAAGVLVLQVLPRQERLVVSVAADGPPAERSVTARLAMHTGLFNLLWAVVTVLMIVRPGSTTGA
ncbi:hypothetical protein KCV87_28435 [Actinosynnema pretiosum subsp. pretiosum]|uniref:Integral membrane protein n=1 Tax=Actinosynnema pretiosum subsp. pretiosum TaxID=103721 RepID=A0AA45R2Z7_9PSEU|nr:integral membrane protein [Actinosynnema pretiosum subsp. pretiosum]QUF03302.1 hypothetical protein KCV87_28435 [Actinosynnema pretiosum subsp. pretiosum]